MSCDRVPVPQKGPEESPWPDGKDPRTGFLVILVLGINPKTSDVDFSLNHAAKDYLCQADRAYARRLLLALAQDFA